MDYSKKQIETLEHLEKIFSILNKLKIPFFLDCGTLLKFIRHEKKLYPGHDVDLGIFKECTVDFSLLKKKLELKGYSLTYQDGFSIFYDQLRIDFQDDYEGFSKHLDIYIYEKKGNSIVRKIPHKFCKNSFFTKFLFYSINYLYKLENKSFLFKKLYNLLRYLFCKIYSNFAKSVHQSFDYECFEPQIKIDYKFIQGNSCNFNIPKNYEKYLVKRYGKNWIYPDKNWEKNFENFSFCNTLNLEKFKFISKPWRKTRYNRFGKLDSKIG